MGLSLVIVTHNRLEQLKRVIPSIEAQQLQYELVIIDDGSSDGTHKWINTLGNDNIKFLRIAPHFWRNPSHAKNFGVACASNDIVVVQDAEILHESYVLWQINHHFRSASQPILVKPAHAWYEEEGKEPIFQPDPPRTCMLFAIQRKDYIRLGGFNEKWYTQWGNDDVEFTERCEAAGIKIVEDPEMKIRHLAHKLPPNGDVERWKKECKWSNRYVERLREGKARPILKWQQ